MALIKSRGNKATELRLMAILRRHKLCGWRRHLSIPGTPDFAFPSARVAIFVDGCFWHGCASHHRAPAKSAYWVPKVRRNQRRDRRVTRALRAAGWSVLRFWEHALGDEARVVSRITLALARRAAGSVTVPVIERRERLSAKVLAG